MTSKANEPQASRRQFLVAAPAAAVAASVPIAAAAAGVTPGLAKSIAEWQVAHDEYLRLSKIDNEIRAHYLRIAPEIPECILLSSYDPYPKLNRNCYAGHLRSVCRGRDETGAIPEIILASYWRGQLANSNYFTTAAQARYAEYIRVADEFVAADEAAYEAAGREAANDAVDEAFDRASALEREVEEFEAQSWADVVSIVRVSKIVSDREPDDVWRETWDNLIGNIERVAAKVGV